MLNGVMHAPGHFHTLFLIYCNPVPGAIRGYISIWPASSPNVTALLLLPDYCNAVLAAVVQWDKTADYSEGSAAKRSSCVNVCLQHLLTADVLQTR